MKKLRPRSVVFDSSMFRSAKMAYLSGPCVPGKQMDVADAMLDGHFRFLRQQILSMLND